MDVFKIIITIILFPAIAILIFYLFLVSSSHTNEIVEQETNIEYNYDLNPEQYYYYYYPYYFYYQYYY